ncbi:MAG TPA: hypothetical protein VGL53_03960 [Bryobacteraceae bacterium]
MAVAIVSVSAEIGCPAEETARLAASSLGYHLVTEFSLSEAIDEEFGAVNIPPLAWIAAVQSILCRMAASHHLLLAFPGCEHLFQGFSAVLRVDLTASEARRIGNFMLEHQLDRPASRRRLAAAVRKRQVLHESRFGDAAAGGDLAIRMDHWTAEQAAQVIHSAAEVRHLAEQGYLGGASLTQFEFDMRLALAAHGLAPKGRADVKSKIFSHPSEELFANLLDFYRIAWVYEPRSFPLQWSESGAVTEAFTPDFYLPECDLYVELTTMKQSLVTRKNRKVKLLKAIYPHINIQIFYQKDFQDLVFKYGIRAVH